MDSSGLSGASRCHWIGGINTNPYLIYLLMATRNPVNSPVEVKIVEIYHYLQGLSIIPGGWEWDFWTINSISSGKLARLRNPKDLGAPQHLHGKHHRGYYWYHYHWYHWYRPFGNVCTKNKWFETESKSSYWYSGMYANISEAPTKNEWLI